MASTLFGFESSGFLPWRHLRILVYAAPADNEKALCYLIVDTCQAISNHPGTSEWMRQPMIRRVEVHIESHGGHSEHLIEVYPLSDSSQI
jgi:hypothetical protein